MKPEIIADYRNDIGEGPIWHVRERNVYWVDIPKGRLFRYDPRTCEHSQLHEGPALGAVLELENGHLLMLGDRGSVGIWDGSKVRVLHDEIEAEKGTRFNDATVDPRGRVLGGTMPNGDRPGRLYRIDHDGSVHEILRDAGLSNGMAFSLDEKFLYHTNSTRRTITRYEYDMERGELGASKLLVEVPNVPGEGVPDGLTIDSEGYLWSARFGGSCIVRYSPEGKEVARIPFPARNITSMHFGGDDLRELYVTSAGGQKRDSNGPAAGALFRLKMDVPGVKPYIARIQPPS